MTDFELPWRPCPTLCEPYPAEYVEASAELLRQTLEVVGEYARPLAGLVIERYPQYADEMRGAASVIGAPVEDLIVAELSYDLMVAFGCSTMALATDDGPVLARNMDWAPEVAIARASCVTGLPHGRQAGFVGHVGVVTGCSDRGFALALNAVASGSPDLDAWPMLLFTRHVLDTADGFDSALGMLTTEPLATAGLLTLVGTRNDQRAVVERSGRRAEVRTPDGDAPLLVTNHFRRMAEPGEVCPRFEALTGLSASVGRSPSDEELLYALTDGRVLQGITAQHVISRPWKNELKLYVPRHLLA